MPLITTRGAASARGFGFARITAPPILRPLQTSDFVTTLSEYAYRGATYDRISGYWLYNQAQEVTSTIYRMSLTPTGTVTTQGSFSNTTPGPGQRGYVVHPTQNLLYSCSYGNLSVFIGSYTGNTASVTMSQTGAGSLEESPWGMTYDNDLDRLVVAQAFNSNTASYWSNFSNQTTLGARTGTISFRNEVNSVINACGIAYDTNARCYYVCSYDVADKIYVCNPDGTTKAAPILLGVSKPQGIDMLAYYNGILICQPDGNNRSASNRMQMFYRAVQK